MSENESVRHIADMIYAAMEEACNRPLLQDTGADLRRMVDAYVADVRANPHAMGVTRELPADFDIEDAYRTGEIPLLITSRPTLKFTVSL